MKKYAILSLAVLLALLFTLDTGAKAKREAKKKENADRETSLTLCENGKTKYVICISPDSTKAERHAAEELALYLKEITGAEFPIKDDGKLRPESIVVGRGKILEQAAQTISEMKLGDEELVIAARGKNLILTGGRPRGSLYAVYEFLDTRLGCRWFTKDIKRIPKSDTIKLSFSDYRFKPALEYREPFFTEAFDPEWAAHNRMNSKTAKLEEKHGGNIVYGGFVHTFNNLVPPQKYFKDHPEYYSEINGKRTAERAQLCLTNPDVLKIVVEEVKKIAKDNPAVNIISVSQNDWWGWCTCPKCSALAEKEESQSGPVIHFVNAVADAIKADCPNVAIDTLAYLYTRNAPKFVRPLPNVIVRLCSIECCFAHPLDDPECPDNVKFAKDIADWSKICNRLYVWDYVTNFSHYHAPNPNIRVLSPNIKFFVKHNVKGLFEQGAYQEGGGGESAELKSYIIARSLWKPETDARQSMTEFIEGVYGPAAKPILAYYDMLHDNVGKTPVHIHIYDHPKNWITREINKNARELYDEATKAAGDDKELQKSLRKFSMWMKYAIIAGIDQVWDRDKDKVCRIVIPGYQDLLEKYIADVKEFGVKHNQEFQTIDNWIEQMRAWNEFECPVYKLENKHVMLEILPYFGGRLHQLFFKDSGNETVFRQPKAGEPGYPLSGGSVESVQKGSDSCGWNEEYTVKMFDKNLINMQTRTDNGLLITKEWSLDADKPLLTFKTDIRNETKAKFEITKRKHAGFAIGDPRDCMIYYKDAAGKWNKMEYIEAAKRDSKNVMLGEKEIGGGEWILWNDEFEVGVHNRFDPAKTESLLIQWIQDQRRAVIVLAAKPANMTAGGSYTYEHSYEIIDSLPKELNK